MCWLIVRGPSDVILTIDNSASAVPNAIVNQIPFDGRSVDWTRTSIGEDVAFDPQGGDDVSVLFNAIRNDRWVVHDGLAAGSDRPTIRFGFNIVVGERHLVEMDGVVQL